jgi:diadenosine tetraphosphate (Ap4A) HIT family hydrolase
MTTCVFCDFSKIKDRTIATIDGFHVTISLGQITNSGYLLLIPTKHTTCLGAMGKIQTRHFEAVLDEAFDNLYLEYDQSVSFFEHGLVGQTIKHAHLHIFPATVNLKKRIVTDFPNSEIQVIKDFSQLRLEYKKRKTPYLLWSTPRGEMLACWNPPAPPEYLRIIVAEILGIPERASWRNMNPKLDKKLADETMSRLFPYFNP